MCVCNHTHARSHCLARTDRTMARALVALLAVVALASAFKTCRTPKSAVLLAIVLCISFIACPHSHLP